MIEVFKTNVEDGEQALRLVSLIHKNFNNYSANFDLEDCDRILRVECRHGMVESNSLVYLLHHHGYDAEVLEDTVHPLHFYARHSAIARMETG
ncbi:MAG: hypothetical protein ABI472_07295 [Ginsengibacter sp.]